MLVEDAEIIREKIIRSLSSISGTEIIGYSDNAPDAINKISQLKPDLITLDLRLKTGNGWEVLKAIRESGNKATVIILTNYSDTGIIKKCLEAGADYFLDKADEFEKLEDICKIIIQQRNFPDKKKIIYS